MSPAKLLLPHEYIDDVAKRIDRAKERVCVLAMVIIGDDSTDEIVRALSNAAKRGVKVEMAADIFTYAELNGFIFPNKYRTKQSRSTNRMSKTLTKSGVKFTWLGTSSVFILSGRTHSKWCVVDNFVYTFGGVNLYKDGLDNIDYMFRLEDKLLADKLFDEYHSLTHANNHGYAYRSHSFFNGDDEILIDSGLFGDSMIYRRACKLAKEASKVTLVSQYCPTGKLSRLLKLTQSKLYFNPPENASLLNRILIKSNVILTRNKTLYSKSEYLHAKFMIFTMNNGSKIAITGSHNFVNSASLLGTREIALQTRNVEIIKQLENFLDKYVV